MDRPLTLRWQRAVLFFQNGQAFSVPGESGLAARPDGGGAGAGVGCGGDGPGDPEAGLAEPAGGVVPGPPLQAGLQPAGEAARALALGLLQRRGRA